MSMRTKLIGVLTTAVMVAGLAGMPSAHAASTVVVGSGPLKIDDTGNTTGDSLISNFRNVTLTGTAQLTTALITPFTVVDARGTDVGWHMQLVIPVFAGTVGDAIGHNIPLAGVSMDAPSAQGSDGQSTATWTFLGSTTGFGGAGVDIASAAADTTSMGTFVVNPLPLRLTVPTATFDGTYSSAATLTLATLP